MARDFVAVALLSVNDGAVAEMVRLAFACVTGGTPSNEPTTVSVFAPARTLVVVSTVMVELPAPGVTIGGLKEQVTPAGGLEQPSISGEAKPFCPVALTV